MAKRPDIGALAKDLFADEGDAAHPLGGILKDENEARILLIPVDHLEPNPDQPRKHFDQNGIEELTASIREVGLLQPIIVRRKPDDEDRCVIIAGERRWRAAKAAGLKDVPALIRGAEDALEIAIIENLQREDLSPLEEADALQKLKEVRGFTDAELAKVVGKSRQSVSESLSLTKLPEPIKAETLMPNVRQPSKIQLLQVLRAGSPEKTQAAWQALKTGEVRTVRELKERKEPATKGRAKPYSFTYRPEHERFRVTVAFAKSRVTAEEVAAALREALKHPPR